MPSAARARALPYLALSALLLIAQVGQMRCARAQASEPVIGTAPATDAAPVTSSVFLHHMPVASTGSALDNNWQAIVHPPPPAPASHVVAAGRGARQGGRRGRGAANPDTSTAAVNDSGEPPLPPLPPTAGTSAPAQ